MNGPTIILFFSSGIFTSAAMSFIRIHPVPHLHHLSINVNLSLLTHRIPRVFPA